jgi:hypothetical protein
MNIEFMETSVAINLWHDINDDFFFLNRKCNRKD